MNACSRGAGGLVALVALIAMAATPAPAELRLEPGTVAPDGRLVVPFSAHEKSGQPLRLRESELTATVDGEARAADLVSYDEGEPFDLRILLDAAALDVGAAAAWSEAVRRVGGGGGSLVVGGLDGRELLGPERTFDAGRVQKWLDARRDAPLWDGVLAGLDELSGADGASRRVVLLVSSGDERKESKLPVASVAAAADSARVAVWTVATASASAGGRARLGQIARQTGGQFFLTDEAGPAEFLLAVEGVRAAQALVFAAGPQPPVRVRVKADVANLEEASGWIRERRRLKSTGGLPVGPIAALAGVLGAAGFAFWRRRRPVGRLRIAGHDPIPVSRNGLTIGAAVGNRLVLDDPSVSRNHAVLRVQGSVVTLVDLRSSNGTKVNGHPVTSHELEHGDQIELAGAVDLVWERFRFGARR